MKKSKFSSFFYEWFIFILIVLAGVLIVYQIFYSKNKGNIYYSNLALINQDYSKDWFLGNRNAKLVLVYYSDFKCPACAYYHTKFLNNLLKDFKDQILIVFRHFPLPGHSGSRELAYAAEAAGKQGKFWEMADSIFNNQQKFLLSKDLNKEIMNLALFLNIDIEKFKSDLNSEEVKNKVEKDYLDALKMNLPGTPSFFLNGRQIFISASYDEFKIFLENEIKKINSN
jgi:protein-disulfide isomerase